jgi:transposase
VNSLGMPISYRLYPGNTFEGSTLINGIDEDLKEIDLPTLRVVGDAGMLSDKNLLALEKRA